MDSKHNWSRHYSDYRACYVNYTNVEGLVFEVTETGNLYVWDGESHLLAHSLSGWSQVDPAIDSWLDSTSSSVHIKKLKRAARLI